MLARNLGVTCKHLNIVGRRPYTVKKVGVIPFPLGRNNYYSHPGRVWYVTSRLRTGIWLMYRAARLHRLA